MTVEAVIMIRDFRSICFVHRAVPAEMQKTELCVINLKLLGRSPSYTDTVHAEEQETLYVIN